MTAAGIGTTPSDTPKTATAWNSSPFVPCMVPTRTASFDALAVSDAVLMPALSSAELACFPSQPPLRGMQVLRLVDDDMPVWRRLT